MPQRRMGPEKVGPGDVWVYSDYIEKSWDSRYFGPIALADVRTSARVLVRLP